MFGTYTVLGNAYLGLEQKTVTIKILNTNSPIIERFIYPWMMECIESNPSYQNNTTTPFPRLDLVIKFWKPSDLEDTEFFSPSFIYYLTGLFPTSLQPYNPVHNATNPDNNRDVTFGFNQFVILPNINIANQFGLGYLYDRTFSWSSLFIFSR